MNSSQQILLSLSKDGQETSSRKRKNLLSQTEEDGNTSTESSQSSLHKEDNTPDAHEELRPKAACNASTLKYEQYTDIEKDSNTNILQGFHNLSINAPKPIAKSGTIRQDLATLQV